MNYDFPEAETMETRKTWKKSKRLNDWLWAIVFILFATAWVVWTTEAVTITCK